MEFVSAVPEDGDMLIITLFSGAIHPNNLVIMIAPPAVFICIHIFTYFIPLAKLEKGHDEQMPKVGVILILSLVIK